MKKISKQIRKLHGKEQLNKLWPLYLKSGVRSFEVFLRRGIFFKNNPTPSQKRQLKRFFEGKTKAVIINFN